MDSKCNKIAWDKYYTPPTVARWCIDKVYEVIGKENITEVIEPSAGCGMFSLQIPGCKAYDLYPQSEYIEQADFTKLELEYKKGRLFIGNPPFGGSARKLLKTFYNKACDAGDYIAYIQPASFHNDYSIFNRFEIVYSIIIKTHYTNKDLWTSFTIYKRNPDKDDWSDEYEKQRPKLKDITITRVGRKNDGTHKTNIDYDYCYCCFGVLFTESKPYKHAGVHCIKIHNEALKEKVIRFFRWLYDYEKETKIMQRKCVGSVQVSSDDVMKVLKICIPEIK